MGKLFLLMGVAGSGKSTWAMNHVSPLERYVSRDEIRFSMVAENEEYFSKEKKVFKRFATTINNYLHEDYNVYADATHLNKASRNKLLRAITEKPDEINIIWVRTPLKDALNQNENRKGTRSYVPKEVIHRMYNQLESPTFEEGFDTIYIIEKDKKMQIKKKVKNDSTYYG